MGLGFSEGDARWAYSGFMRFREKLATEIGICLPLMDGYWSIEFSRSTVELTKRMVGSKVMDENFYWLPKEPLKWDNIKDPIVKLLRHSDCEGHLTYGECKKIAPRLRELIKDWNENDYDMAQATLLAEGMDICVKEKKSLMFY